MSLFGDRRRKLLLGVAALGFLLAALVGFLLAPDGGRDNSVRVQLSYVFTNEQNQVEVYFCVTNIGTKAIRVEALSVENRSVHRIVNAPPIGPGQSYHFVVEVDSSISKNGLGSIQFRRQDQRCRVIVYWHNVPTRFQTWIAKLRTKASSIHPTLKRDQQALWSSLRHTNYSADIPR